MNTCSQTSFDDCALHALIGSPEKSSAIASDVVEVVEVVGNNVALAFELRWSG